MIDQKKKKSLRIYLPRVDESRVKSALPVKDEASPKKADEISLVESAWTLRSKTPFESTNSNESLATKGGQSFVFNAKVRSLRSATNDNY